MASAQALGGALQEGLCPAACAPLPPTPRLLHARLAATSLRQLRAQLPHSTWRRMLSTKSATSSMQRRIAGHGSSSLCGSGSLVSGEVPLPSLPGQWQERQTCNWLAYCGLSMGSFEVETGRTGCRVPAACRQRHSGGSMLPAPAAAPCPHLYSHCSIAWRS